MEIQLHSSLVQKCKQLTEYNNNYKIIPPLFEKKLKLLDFFLQNEIEISEIVKKIKNFQNHYLVIIDYQSVDIGTLQFKTNILYNAYELENKYIIINTLSQSNIILYNKYFERQLSPKMNIYNIIISYHYLLNSLYKLNDKKVCYFNFNTDNIVFYHDYPLLTDFSSSFTYNSWNIDNALKFVNHTNNLPIQPLEVVLLFYMDKHNISVLSYEHIDIILKNYYDHIPFKHYINNETYSNIINEGNIFLTDLLKKSSSEIIDMMKNYIDTWDNYAISMTYITLLYRVIDMYKLTNTIINKLLTHLLECINPSPHLRKKLHYMTMLLDELFIKYKNWDFVKQLNTCKEDFNVFV